MDNTSSLKKVFKDLQNKFIRFQTIDNALGGICEKYWLIAKNKKFLFKFPNENDYSDFGEVFTSYLSYYLGYKCVKSIFHKGVFEKEEWGTLIEDYRNKNVIETISLRHLKDKYYNRLISLSTKEVFRVCKLFAEDNDLILDKNLSQELKEMALMDYLLIQVDRNANNIEFLIEKNKDGKKVLKLAPMFDNGFCLFLYVPQNAIGQVKEDYEQNRRYYINSVLEKIKFYVDEDNSCNKIQTCVVDEVLKGLALEILNNKKMCNLYEKFKSINLEAEIDFVCSIYKRKLPQIYKDTIVLAIKDRIKQLDLEICAMSMKKAKELEI